jgi:hypothetical protein
MSEIRALLERKQTELHAPAGSFERLIRRRDRKRRNQRIAAGFVGIAVFVAAVWIVTSEGWLDRGETSVVPGTDVTGPAAETGPVETGPTVAPETGSNGNDYRIPPVGTAVSTPVEGELIAEAFFPIGQIRVYADGRVLSAEHNGGKIVERRLSPEGVELVRQVLGERVHLGYGPGAGRLESLLGHPGSYPGDIRQSAWEDREGKPYVPARYGLCFRLVDVPLDVEAVLNKLPASAQALLRGSDTAAWNRRCLVMTPEEARSLEKILREAFSSPSEIPLLGWDVGVWSLPGGDDAQFIRLRPLFPEGRWFVWVPF